MPLDVSNSFKEIMKIFFVGNSFTEHLVEEVFVVHFISLLKKFMSKDQTSTIPFFFKILSILPPINMVDDDLVGISFMLLPVVYMNSIS